MADIAPEIYGGDVDPALAHEFADKMRPGDSRGYLYQMLGAAGWTSLAWLRCLRQRTLILAGDDDRLVPVVKPPILPQLIPHSRLHVFHRRRLGPGLQATPPPP